MSVEVGTGSGRVAGIEADGVRAFKGIPFARDPVGELRFRPPVPPEPWTGVREATAFGLAAPQDPIPMMSVGEIGERCLTLNVWTPGLDDARRPVLFWIHGGGFMVGSTAQAEYDGAALARRGDVVVVSANYRLGAMGFLHLAALLGEGAVEAGCASNLGIRDQIAALEWVREHAAAFGGDPGNVTVFGESAGGMSVSTLLGTPAARGLFHKAIAQSGASHHVTDPADATRVAEAVFEKLELDPSSPGALDALCARPFGDVLRAQRRGLRVPIRCGPWRLPHVGMTLVPVVDGDLLPESPHDAIAGGLSAAVPLLTGTTREEWKLFSSMTSLVPDEMRSKLPAWADVSDDNVGEAFEQLVPGHGERLLAVYRELAGDGASAKDAYTALETDRMFRVPALRMIEAHAANAAPGTGSWMYRFDWESPMFGAGHAVDLPFVFGCVETPFGMMFTGGGQRAVALSERVMDAWIAFARAGDPGHDGLPTWPAYEPAARPTMILADHCELREREHEVELAAWDPIR